MKMLTHCVSAGALLAILTILIGLQRQTLLAFPLGWAISLAWGEKKQADLKQLLEEMTWLDINHPDVLDAYAELDDWSERANRKIGKNDLWIAATAKVTGARC